MFFQTFCTLKNYVENFLDSKINIFRSDGGGEFTGTLFKQFFFSSHGILCQSSCRHTPDQTGVAERKHRHIVETGLSLLVHSVLPTYYWFEAFNTVVYLINMMPIVPVPKISPYEALFHVVPDYTSL